MLVLWQPSDIFTRMNPPMFYGSMVYEKAELFAYKLKHVACMWYTKCKDIQALEGGPMNLEIFKKALFHILFLREQKEAKVEDIIKVLQRFMIVKEYSLKLIKLSKFASSLGSDNRDEMIRYVTGVSKEL